MHVLGVLDGIAQVGQRKGGGCVHVHGRVAHVGGHELEQRDLVDGHLVGGIESLTVVGGTAAPADAVPHGIFLRAGVDETVGLVNTGGSVCLELQLQALEDIPVDGIITRPVEGFHVVGVNDDVTLALGTVLELLQVAVERGTEHKVLRHGSDIEVPDNLQPFALQPFGLRERTVILRIRTEGVADFTMVNVLIVHFHILIALHQLGIGVGEVEVLYIPRMHLTAFLEVALLADVHQVDILAARNLVRQITQGVALLQRQVGQLVLHLHVGIQRVVLRLHHRQRVVVVDRNLDIPLFREEQLAAVDVGGEVEVYVRLVGAFGDRLLQASETWAGVHSRNGQVAHIGEGRTGAQQGSETLTVVKPAQPQLVNPHFHRLGLHIVIVVLKLLLGVADTYHDGRHLAQIRVTDHSVYRTGIRKRRRGIRHQNAGMSAVAHLAVTLHLQGNQGV